MTDVRLDLESMHLHASLGEFNTSAFGLLIRTYVLLLFYISSHDVRVHFLELLSYWFSVLH